MTTKRKPAPKAEGPKGKLNKAYRYGQAHVATVALVALGIGIVLTAFGFYSFFNERDIERRVTKVESPCNIAPAGKKCQSIKKRSDEKRSVASACVLAYKLDKNGQLLRLTKCPVEPSRQSKIEAAERHPAPGPLASVATKGGDASDAPTGSSQPGRHDGGSSESGSAGDGEAGHPPKHHESPSVSGEPSHGGEAVSPSAPSKESSESSSSSSTTATERSTEVVREAAPPVSPSAPEPAAAPVREAVGGVVEEVGSTVTGTVEGVEATTCQLAKLLCP